MHSIVNIFCSSKIMEIKQEVIDRLKDQNKRKYSSAFRLCVTYCIGKLMVDYDTFINTGEFYKMFLSDLFEISSFNAYMTRIPEANGDKVLYGKVKDKLVGLIFENEREFNAAASGAAFSGSKINKKVIEEIEAQYRVKLFEEINKQLNNKL